MLFNSENAFELFGSVWWHCGVEEPTHDAPDGSGYLQKAWDGTQTSAMHGEWWIRKRGRWWRLATGVGIVDIGTFGAISDVIVTTCTTTAGSDVITVTNATGAKVGQVISVRAAADTALATHLALTGVTTHYVAGQPPGNDQAFPYIITDSLFQCTQTLLSPKQLHRYIEIPGAGPAITLPSGETQALYRGYVSDIGGTDNGGHKRSVLAAAVYRLGQNLEDPGADALAVTGGTGTLGGDNLTATITNVSGNTLTLSLPAAASLLKTDCFFGTDASTALELALTFAPHVIISKRYALGPFTNNHECATLEFMRGGQFFQTGEFASNGNKFHVIGHTSGITGGGVSDQRAEFIWCGPVKGNSIHVAAGTPPIGGASNIQSSYADHWEQVGTHNVWLTPHATGYKIGEHVIGIGSYGMGGGTLTQPTCIDYHAGAGRALWWAHATQQAYCYDFRAFPTEPSQNGSGGNLGRGTGLFIGAHGTGGVTASWFRGGTIQGFQEVVNANSCDTTTFADFVIEDQTIMGGIVVKCNEVSRFECSGHHQEDTGLVPRSVNPLAHANRNRFIRLGEAQSPVHAQYAAGAPLADVTGPFTIVNGPRRLRVDFGSGTIAAVTVTITGTDYTGNVLVALFTPTPGAGPAVVQGFGLDLFDSVTSITSNINPGVTVDVMQPQHVAQDVVMHHIERIAGSSIGIERIASNGFYEHHNGIVLTNENTAYPATYFLATDTGNPCIGADLGFGSQVEMTTDSIHLANSSFVAVPEVGGLIQHFGRFPGGEFGPRVDNAEHPVLKFGSTHTVFMHGSVLDSRLSNLAFALAQIRGNWHFDNTIMTGDGLNWTVNMQDGAIATWRFGHFASFAVNPLNNATAIAPIQTPYFQIGTNYWNGSASVSANILFVPRFSARTPNLHEELDIYLAGGAAISTIFYRNEADPFSKMSLGLNSAGADFSSHLYTLQALGPPTSAVLGVDAILGSIAMRADGATGSSGYLKEASGDAGWHPITTGGPFAPLSGTVQATTPLLIDGNNSPHDLSVPRLWAITLGTDGQVLTTLSGVATWATPAGGFVPTSRTLEGIAPILVGGVHTPVDLSANRQIAIEIATTSAHGSIALTTDLGGNGTTPTVLAATGAGGTFTVRCANLTFTGAGNIATGSGNLVVTCSTGNLLVSTTGILTVTSVSTLQMASSADVTLTGGTDVTITASAGDFIGTAVGNMLLSCTGILTVSSVGTLQMASSADVTIDSGGTSNVTITAAADVVITAGSSDAVIMTVGSSSVLLTESTFGKLGLVNHEIVTPIDLASGFRIRVNGTDWVIPLYTDA